LAIVLFATGQTRRGASRQYHQLLPEQIRNPKLEVRNNPPRQPVDITYPGFHPDAQCSSDSSSSSFSSSSSVCFARD
jgi:hypothetical protein